MSVKTTKPDKKEKFLQKLELIYKGDFKQIIEDISYPKPVVFRINTIKATPEVVLKDLALQDFNIKEGPLPNSYFIEDSKIPLSETDQFKNGEIYIQRLSSMVPVIKFKPKPSEKILDLCAAPGSKTSQISALTGNQAQIVAVENNRSRFFALQKNLQNLGVTNVQLLMENASFLDKNHPELLETFDKVLVDAPCSNEGLICICDRQSLVRRNPKTGKHLSKLQKRLLAVGIKMLKRGGNLIYSTCTYSLEENEEVVEWVLKKFPEIKLLEQQRIIPDKLFSGFYFALLSK